MAQSNGDEGLRDILEKLSWGDLDNGVDEAMQAVLADRKQHELELLDRLMAQEWRFGEGDDAMAVPTRYIKAERERLSL